MSNEKLRVRANQVRKLSLSSIYHAASGHPGGVLSCADLVTYIYHELVDLHQSNRLNRFVLSKGHAAPVLYAAAAIEGICDFEEAKKLRKLGSVMQGHPHVASLDWVETSTGSLGQGFSAAIGMALALSHEGKAGNIYTMLGDGELQEGQVWEGAMFAAHNGLGNLCAIIDYNKLQSDDRNENIVNLEPLSDKWAAFNWHVIEIDGHDFAQIDEAFKSSIREPNKPTVIIAHTVKGKGVSFMENEPAWHGSVAIKTEELEQALSELGASETDLLKYL